MTFVKSLLDALKLGRRRELVDPGFHQGLLWLVGSRAFKEAASRADLVQGFSSDNLVDEKSVNGNPFPEVAS